MPVAHIEYAVATQQIEVFFTFDIRKSVGAVGPFNRYIIGGNRFAVFEYPRIDVIGGAGRSQLGDVVLIFLIELVLGDELKSFLGFFEYILGGHFHGFSPTLSSVMGFSTKENILRDLSSSKKASVLKKLSGAPVPETTLVRPLTSIAAPMEAVNPTAALPAERSGVGLISQSQVLAKACPRLFPVILTRNISKSLGAAVCCCCTA